MRNISILPIISILLIYTSTINAEMDGFSKSSYDELTNQKLNTKNFNLKSKNTYKAVDQTKKKGKQIKNKKRSRQKRKDFTDKKLSFEEMSKLMANRR